MGRQSGTLWWEIQITLCWLGITGSESRSQKQSQTGVTQTGILLCTHAHANIPPHLNTGSVRQRVYSNVVYIINMEMDMIVHGGPNT